MKLLVNNWQIVKDTQDQLVALKSSSAQTDKDRWQELNQVHDVMCVVSRARSTSHAVVQLCAWVRTVLRATSEASLKLPQALLTVGATMMSHTEAVITAALDQQVTACTGSC